MEFFETFTKVLAKHCSRSDIQTCVRIRKKTSLYKYIFHTKIIFFLHKKYTVAKISTNQIFVYKSLSINDYCEFSFDRYRTFLKWRIRHFKNKKYLKMSNEKQKISYDYCFLSANLSLVIKSASVPL